MKFGDHGNSNEHVAIINESLPTNAKLGRNPMVQASLSSNF